MVKRFLLGSVAVTAALAAAVVACAPQTGREAKAEEKQAVSASARPPAEESGLGAYLAGRFAQAHGDTRAASDYYVAAARHDRENQDLQQRAFTLVLAEGRLEEAVPMAERLLAIDEDAALPSIMMGVRDGRDGRYAEAEKHFAVLPQKGINGFLGPLLKAWALAGQGKFDDALKMLAPRTDTAGFAPIFDFHAALIADLAGRTDMAAEHFKASLAAQTSVRTVEAAGAFYQRNGHMDDAAALYQRYHADHFDRTLLDGRRQLALGAGMARTVDSAATGLAEAMFDTASLVRQGNAHDLAMVFTRLALAARPDFPVARLLLADILAQQRRFTESNAIYRAIDPNTQPGRFARLRLAVNFDAAGEDEAAIKELRELSAEWADGTDSLLTLGDILRRHKRFPEAAEAYDQALARIEAPNDARHWSLYYARGIALERSRQWARAEKDFLAALHLSPDQPDVLNYLGYTWVDQGINLEQGRKMIARAAELRPKDGAIIDSLGWALYRMGEYQVAVKQLERAAELKPEDPTINEHLGDALWQVGRVAEARYQWQRAMTLDPEPEQIEPLKYKIATGQLPSQPGQ
ncbi:FOG: TPR repeat [Candidatus Terasakiella magnetica]|nr:FOG: TPR repeat [Candidatus Terasakiella magnetica]